MRNYFMKSLIALAVLTFVSVPLPVNAQSSDVGLSIGTSSSTVTRGGGVAVFALVTNNSSAKVRVTVSLSAHSACGTETSLGSQRVALDPGKSVSLSVYYTVPADACMGMYAITISNAGRVSDKTAAPAPSATAYLEVK